MRVILLGTGTSHPSPDRVQSGVLVETEGVSLLLDIGSGVLRRLNEAHVDLLSLQHVFVSHFHVDHCSDFATLLQTLWMSGYDGPLSVYGPEGLDRWLEGLLDISYPYLKGRVPLKSMSLKPYDTIEVASGVRVETCPTIHSTMDSRAFKIVSEDRSIVYTSDTAPSDDVVRLASGVDLLIHECNWLDGDHPAGAHTSPSELNEIIRRAAPRRVVLTHVAPEVVDNAAEVLATVKRGVDADVILAEDLLRFDL